jgi:hypothetical protein
MAEPRNCYASKCWARVSPCVLQANVAACGTLYVGTASSNSTFSVTTVNTPECEQQQAQLAAGAGSKHSCSRCPILDADTVYDMILVAEAAGAASGPVHITVSAHGARERVPGGRPCVRRTAAASRAVL